MININSTSKKSAIVVSYLVLLFNTLNSILLTPILLKYMGVDEYGLYQMVYSVGSYILILDMGIGTVMIRYISELRFKEDKRGESNFAGMIGILALTVCLIISVGLKIIDVNIESIYSDLSDTDYSKSHVMLTLMIAQFVITILANYLHGIINAYERFVLSKTLNLVQIILSFGLTILFVVLGYGAVGIVLAHVVIAMLKLIVECYYVLRVLHFKIRLYYWDSAIIKPVVGLMLAIFLQHTVMYINTWSDKTILGIMCEKSDVAVYAVACTLLTFFSSTTGILSGLFQPQIVKMVVKNADATQLTDVVIRVGRWQFMLTGSILAGMALFGRDFIALWVGEKMLRAWIIFLIITPFFMIPLIQSVCISILNALDKRLYRSLILLLSSVINILITIVLIKQFGPLGAPVGTAISYLLGHIICLNIYYKRNIHLQVGRMFREILSKTWLSIFITCLICTPLLFWNNVSIISMSIKCIIFSSCVLILQYFWGFNSEERKLFSSLLSKLQIK